MGPGGLIVGHEEVRAAGGSAGRTSRARLVAILAAPTRDIPLAEDSLADAFERALRRWPADGIPTNPEGWLLTVARNRQLDVLRSAAHGGRELEDIVAVIQQVDPEAIPERRLELLFACAHPAIAVESRTPLMLQVVLGLEAVDIARAYAVPASTMAQRLVRAKRRIRETGIPFTIPSRADMPARLGAVLEAVYGAYAVDLPIAGIVERESLAAETLFLAVTIAKLTGDAEALGLAALLSFSTARTPARGVGFVPLDEQDRSLWDASLIAQGEELLRRAATADAPGRFQIEAAIQSWHCAQATDMAALVTLHRALVAVAPTLGAQVALAAVLDPQEGLAVLDGLDERAERFQPAWATRAHLLRSAGSPAAEAYEKAISLTTDAGLRSWLEARAATTER